jgi:hypothetical protein
MVEKMREYIVQKPLDMLDGMVSTVSARILHGVHCRRMACKSTMITSLSPLSLHAADSVRLLL